MISRFAETGNSQSGYQK